MSKKRNPGLNPRSFPTAVREFAEIDYESQLGPDERAWLERFNNAMLAGDFRGWTQEQFSQEQRREIWRGLKRQTKDVLAYEHRAEEDGVRTKIRLRKASEKRGSE